MTKPGFSPRLELAENKAATRISSIFNVHFSHAKLYNLFSCPERQYINQILCSSHCTLYVYIYKFK